MKKFAAFDLEIAKELPEGCEDWREFSPLGISCAAMAFSDDRPNKVWSGVPSLDIVDCMEMVSDLERISEEYTLVSWNGCKFDFPVLAEESEYPHRCAELAKNHIDIMMIVTFVKGWYLGLDAALIGQNLGGKKKAVRLNDGTTLHDMSGAKVPELWSKGEYDAVLSYLNEDVVPLVKLVQILSITDELHWKSKKGRHQVCEMRGLPTVAECFSIPQPDVSWMDNPPQREDFVSWME